MTGRLRRAPYSCELRNKVRYVSERIANVRADELTARTGTMLWVYRCPDCKSWHHTSLRPKGSVPPWLPYVAPSEQPEMQEEVGA